MKGVFFGKLTEWCIDVVTEAI